MAHDSPRPSIPEARTSSAIMPNPDPAVIEPSYADDRCTMYFADALETLAMLPTASVDAVVTDPPYSSGGRRENARSIRKSMIRSMDDDDWIMGDGMSTAGFVWMMRTLAIEARRVLKPGGHLLAFIDWRMHSNLAAALESADLRQHPTLVWDKTQIGMGAIFRNQHEWICHFTAGSPIPPQRRDVGNVIACPPVRDGDHPTQKPIPLMRTLVSVVCPEGGTVLDPFAGAGSTGVGAILEGRRFVGCEGSKHFVDVAVRRCREAQLLAVEREGQPDLFGGVA